MAQIQVGFFGCLQSPWPENHRTLNLQEGSSVEDLLERLTIGESETLRICVLVNGKRCEFSTILNNGDNVELVMLAGGG